MAALPITQRGLDADIPAVAQQDGETLPPGRIVLEFTANRDLALNSQPVGLASLEQRLSEVFATRGDKTLFLDAAATLRYAEVIAVIDAAKGAGVTRLGVITPGMKQR